MGITDCNILSQIENTNLSRVYVIEIGRMLVALLIPCHRVIQSSGNTGGYMWGITRKTPIIGWECAKTLSISI